jgi:ribosome-associated protein
MDIRKLQRAIVDGLEDVKAQNIRVFNTEHLSPLFERVVVASGTSNRQTKALAASVRDSVKAAGLAVLRTEGEDNGEWIIVDCGAAVVHIMQPTIREYYHLEEIWGDKPVKLKAAEVRGLPKASASADDEPVAATARKKPAAKGKAPAKKASASKVNAAAPAKKTDAKKVAAEKVPAKTSAPKKSVPAKKAAPAKTAAPAKKAAPAKRAATAKAPVARKKPAAKTSRG